MKTASKPGAARTLWNGRRTHSHSTGTEDLIAAPPATNGAWPTVDRLGVPGPITYNGTVYELRWSAQPNPHYFKQEYLPSDQSLERFDRMLLIELIVSGVDVDTAVASQIQMLERRERDDPVVNFEVLRDESTGEIILDFVMSDRLEDGEVVVEWNAYRYAPHVDAEGSRGVALFGISRRAYGSGAKNFLVALKTERPAEIDALARYTLPRLIVGVARR